MRREPARRLCAGRAGNRVDEGRRAQVRAPFIEQVCPRPGRQSRVPAEAL